MFELYGHCMADRFNHHRFHLCFYGCMNDDVGALRFLLSEFQTQSVHRVIL